MPSEVSPQKFQRVAQAGMRRLSNFRKARLLFLRDYVGQYYDRTSGEIGTEPLNLIFNAIRTLVPNLVTNFPSHAITSRFLANRPYAELLELALQDHDQAIRVTTVYRQAIVDAIFTLGILKTGLAESDSLYTLDEYDRVDPGTIYSACVNFDNFVVDPNSKEHLFADAQFVGDRVCYPRRVLLDSGLYNNELVERLPAVGQEHTPDKSWDLSRKSLRNGDDDNFLEEEVEVCELWVPAANAVVTVPGSESVTFDDYLRVDDFYGPDSGPYTYLALTPPVPGNPLPIPAVGIWKDLHTLANRMAKKIVDQAERQKDIVAYRRAAADDAQEALDAGDGEAVAMDDPTALNVLSFGGQKNSNEVQLANLQNWFNMMAANPEALAGQRSDADSATEARILSNNASIGLEDMKDLVYQMAAEESKKRAWFLHTDPFIELPLIRRAVVPAEYTATPQGIVQVSPTRMQEEQVFLTPEARRGEFIDYSFDITPESMGRKDRATRMAEAMDLAVKILPSAMQAAQTALLLGVPFSPKEFIIRMAKDRGITWMHEVFLDPEFQMQMAIRMTQGPQPEPSKGQAGSGQQQPTINTSAMNAIAQNGQPGQVMGGVPSASEQVNRDFQMGAADGQRELKTTQPGAY